MRLQAAGPGVDFIAAGLLQAEESPGEHIVVFVRFPDHDLGLHTLAEERVFYDVLQFFLKKAYIKIGAHEGREPQYSCGFPGFLASIFCVRSFTK